MWPGVQQIEDAVGEHDVCDAARSAAASAAAASRDRSRDVPPASTFTVRPPA